MREPNRPLPLREPPSSVPSGPLTKVCPLCEGWYPEDFLVCPRDATPLEDGMISGPDPLVGKTLGDAFQILRLVGEGGMARVYEARHVRLENRRFAVKVLHPSFADNKEVVTRFQREAEAASGISHPNVVSVYDVNRTPDRMPYLVSEFLEGMDFAELLEQEGKIDILLAINVARQVCRALQAAHDRGVVHRDVKPDNVFLVGNPAAPIVKVIDFGISRMATATGATLTQTGMIMGTPAYMPPEQARGAKVDHRADIYGVGVMLYRALTGRLPFEYDDVGETLHAVLTADAPPGPRTIDRSIPPALELVIQRAMDKNVEKRYASMRDLEADLEPFGAEARASVLPPSALAPPSSGLGTLKTLWAGRPRSDIHRATMEATWARPLLVVLTAALYLWFVGALTNAVATWVAAALETPVPTTMNILLIVAVVLALSLTPVVFWTRHLTRQIWGNSVRAVEIASTLKILTGAAIISYGVGSLLVRLGASTVFPDLNPGAPRWSTILLVISAASAGIAWLYTRWAAAR